MAYKRIVKIDTSETTSFLSHSRNDLEIRPARGGVIGEYVLESPSGLERKAIDLLVDLYNTD